MLLFMVNTSGLVNATLETDETGFEAGFTVSGFSFTGYQINRLDSANPMSNPTFGLLIDNARRKN